MITSKMYYSNDSFLQNEQCFYVVLCTILNQDSTQSIKDISIIQIDQAFLIYIFTGLIQNTYSFRDLIYVLNP